jgi:capsular polysaccharide export protein
LSASHPRIGLFGARLESIPHLRELLGADRVVNQPGAEQAGELDAVAAWAGSEEARAAHAYADAHGLPFLRIADGFLRSLGSIEDGAPPLSLLVDDLGTHDDPSRASRLEVLLERGDFSTTPEMLARASRLRERIVEARLSHTNRAPAAEPPLPPSDRPRVLVIHERAVCADDDSGRAAFELALEAALDEHPEAEIIVGARADARAGLLGASGALADARVRVVTDPRNPHVLFEHIEDVYVASSLVGFDALLAGKTVHCFGGPFYAGWGLTRDRRTFPRRTRTLELDELVAGALIAYPRYLDPERGSACEVERLVEHLALQLRMYEENARRTFAIGFSLWKRSFLPAFLESPGREPIFVKSARQARRRGFAEGDVALVWGATAPEEVDRLVEERRGRLYRMEDGFLRSVRLGAEIAEPASLVIDTRGMYFDPTRPSDLEQLLETATLGEAELARARALREAIVAAGISKYNVGKRIAPEVPASARGRVVLVPGQVEDDASIRLGGVDVRTNLELLRCAREARPDAFIVYKPHPDVWGGHRRGQIDRDEARAIADLIVTDLGLPECLEAADEVHTITSLVGFEALLRGKRVFTYGLPFYAGWGLTHDRHTCARRTRLRSLDELVACALIRYPRYRSSRCGAFGSPEGILEELELARLEAHDLHRVRERWLTRSARKIRNVMKVMRDGR